MVAEVIIKFIRDNILDLFHKSYTARMISMVKKMKGCDVLFRIVYQKHSSGGFFVNLFDFQQKIWIDAGCFIENVGCDSMAVFGCIDVDVRTLINLGFEIPLSLKRNVI